MVHKMQFTKIGFVGEGQALKVKLKYNDLSEGGGHENYDFGCDEAPKDSFIKAMKDMARHVKFFMESTAEYAEDVKVNNVNLSWTKGKMKASLSCTKILYNCVESTFTTPVYAEVLQADDDPTITLPEDVIKSIKTLLGQAKKYVKGERSQIAIPLKSKSGAPKNIKPINGSQEIAPFDEPHSSEKQERGATGRFGGKKSTAKA